MSTAALTVEYDEAFTDILLFGGKRCSTCGHTWPATREHFAPDRENLDGLTSTCRPCRREAQQRNDIKRGRIKPTGGTTP